MKNDKNPEQNIMKIYGQEIMMTQDVAQALFALQEDDGATVKEMLAFADTVALSLSMCDMYSPSEEGKKNALQIVADMKQLLYGLVNDDAHEKYR